MPERCMTNGERASMENIISMLNKMPESSKQRVADIMTGMAIEAERNERKCVHSGKDENRRPNA